MTAAAAILFAALATFSAWLELRRRDRRRLPLRLGAAILSSAALALLVNPPMVRRTHQPEVVLLVTPGAGPGELREIADSIRPARTLALGDSLPDLRTLRHSHPGIRRVVVSGWGLDSAELRHLRGLAIDFVPSDAPLGIAELDWPRDVALGEDVVVRGRAAPLAAVQLRVGLRVADSAAADSTGAFALRARPGAPGAFPLAIEAGGRRDSLSIWVRESRPPALLALRAGPSFEASRLRDWLARRGGSVFSRIDVSRGRARTERVNTAAPIVPELTLSLLDSFDILWIDARALQRLSTREAASLSAAVDSGLGLLLEPNALVTARRVLGEPFPTRASGTAGATRLHWRVGGASAAIPAPQDRIAAMPPGSVLAADDRGMPAVVWFPIGLGSVVTSVVTRPSRWLLEGERGAYDAYWSHVLSAAARPRARWELVGASLPTQHHPVLFRRDATDPIEALVRAPSGRLDTVHVDPAPAGRVEGRYWPREAGLHMLTGAGDSLGFDVMDAGSWTSLRAHERLAATRRWVATQPASAAAGTLQAFPSALPRTWLFPLILSGMTYLWWERRVT